MTDVAVDGTPLVDTLDGVLAYARERDYTGWDFGDGMSSRIRRWLPVETTISNLGFQEIVKRAPINVRPLLLVERRRNYQGGALFSMANLARGRLIEAGHAPEADYRGEARDLLDWLVETRRDGYAGYCGGHNHPLQHLEGDVGRPEQPDVVSTAYGVKALLRGSEADIDPVYADVAATAPDFVFEDLDYRPVDGGARINYHMNKSGDDYTINAGALGARLLIDVYAHTGDEALRERAEALLDYIASLRTDLGGWYYRHPPDASHLSMDNHHNGFVIEAFLRHAAVTGSDRYADLLSDAVEFYRTVLFDPDGAPNFEEESAYPRDVHASATGALVFTYAGDLDFAHRILAWAVRNQTLDDRRFFYRQYRTHAKRHVLMRWCQAWMAYAISEYLLAVHDLDAPITGEKRGRLSPTTR